jgi:hypothetical protein
VRERIAARKLSVRQQQQVQAIVLAAKFTPSLLQEVFGLVKSRLRQGCGGAGGYG